MAVPEEEAVFGSLRFARSRGNGIGAIARASPQTIGTAPHLRPRLRPGRGDPALAVETGRENQQACIQRTPFK
jgi:hypothetical protein